MRRTPGISRKDQHQSAGPNQALTYAEPFLGWERRARSSNIEGAAVQIVCASPEHRGARQLGFAHCGTQKRNALRPRLNHRESGVGPQERKCQSRETATSAHIDD